MTTVINEHARYEPCPVCACNGIEPDPECWLCKGKGHIPSPDVSYMRGGQVYSNSWWACACFKNYIHPENHEFCDACGTSREEGDDAIAADVMLFVGGLRRKAGLVLFPEDELV